MPGVCIWGPKQGKGTEGLRGRWKKGGVKLHWDQQIVRPTNTLIRNKTTPGHLVCLELYLFLSSSSCSRPCFLISMKQTVQNLQYCLHCFEISWASFQPEGVIGQVSKTEYLLKSVFLFSLPWGREGCSEQSQLFSWLRIFPLLGSGAENALRERALLSVKMYTKVLQKADGNTAGAELCLGFPGRSLFLGHWCR